MEKMIEDIAVLMKKNNVNAYSLAKETGISAAGIGKILNKKVKRPHRSTLDLIVNYLNKLEDPVLSTGVSGISHVGGNNNVVGGVGNGSVRISNGGGSSGAGGVLARCEAQLSDCRAQLLEKDRQLAASQDRLAEAQAQVGRLLAQQERLIEKLTG